MLIAVVRPRPPPEPHRDDRRGDGAHSGELRRKVLLQHEAASVIVTGTSTVTSSEAVDGPTKAVRP